MPFRAPLTGKGWLFRAPLTGSKEPVSGALKWSFKGSKGLAHSKG